MQQDEPSHRGRRRRVDVGLPPKRLVLGLDIRQIAHRRAVAELYRDELLVAAGGVGAGEDAETLLNAITLMAECQQLHDPDANDWRSLNQYELYLVFGDESACDDDDPDDPQKY